MTKTENLSLPQWEGTDQVQRKDFNEAFASLDAGYSAMYTAAQEATCFDRACHAAFDRLRILDGEEAALPLLDCGFSEADAPGISGAYQMEDCIRFAYDEEALTADGIIETLSSVKTVNIASTGTTSGTASCTFTAPAAGLITGITLKEGYSGNQSQTNTVTTRFRLYNVSTETLEAESTVSRTLNYDTYGNHNLSLSVSLFVRSGTKYRLEAYVSGVSCNSYTLAFDSSISGMICVSVENTPSCSVSAAFSGQRGGSGALLLARYTTDGAGGALTATLGGQTLSPTEIRTLDSGLSEAEFRLNQALSAGAEAALNVACEDGGEVDLYRFFGLLL